MSATSENLLRLAADSLVHSGDVDVAINSIGRTLGLDGVCVLRRDGDSWSVEASVGRTTVLNPDSAPFGDEIASGRVLAMEGSRLTDLEVAALRSFLDQLRFARERALIEGIEGGNGTVDESTPR